MKHSFKVLIVVVLLSFSIAIGFAVFSMEMQVDKGDPIIHFFRPENEHAYFTKTYADGSPCNEDFKVITIGDPHLNAVPNNHLDGAILTVLENMIKYEKPDLVVICGDVALGIHAEKAIESLGELFQRNNQYWGYALGNHDAEHESGPTREELIDIYARYEHCVITSAPGISGEGNCIINIKNSRGKIIQSLVFIDSGAYLTPEICAEYGFKYKKDYDFIKYDQIEWYKSQMREIRDKNGEMPNSIMFFHIPLKEFRTAYNQAVENDSVIFGARRESECDSPYNTGIFDAILELGSTKAVVCGHDHVNDYCVDYMGVKLTYSLSLSYNSYFLRKDILHILAYQYGGKAQFNDGCTLLSIKMEGSLEIIPKYNQNNPSVFEGLTEKQRKDLYLDETLP